MRRARCGRHRLLAALGVEVIAIDARAERVEIAWDKAGRFETTVSVAPGKFAEVCGKLAQSQSFAWSFKSDVTQLDAVRCAIMVKRKTPSARRSKHLCADNGCRGWCALEIIESHGYIPHVVGRSTEAQAKRRDPTKKARRWVVEVCHSWFNRFRKLLVRYEKLERSFVALNHLAAAIIAFRKVKLTVNIIYG